MIGSINQIGSKLGNAIGNERGTALQGFNIAKRSIDDDAQSFIDAAGVINITHKVAIINLVSDLKNAGLWDKMKAIYPFIGGTASSHKWNLKDPRDSDSAFRIIFNGGWTHSATGALPNGVNAYGDTKLNPSVEYVNIYNNHCSVYLRTGINDAYRRDLACIQSNAATNRIMFVFYTHDGNSDFTNIQGSSRIILTNAVYGNATALHTMSRTANNDFKVYRNDIQKGSASYTESQPAPNANFLIGGSDSGSYSNREVVWVSIGDALNGTEVSDLYTSVQKYQTKLSRQV